MKKLKLLTTLVGFSTLASSCAVITSCSSTNQVKSITVEMNNPVKYIGSSFTTNDLIVKAQYSDGTEKEIGYTSTDKYQDGYDVSGIKMGHEFSPIDIGSQEITVVYKTFAKQVTFQVTQPITASLTGSNDVGLSQTSVVVGRTFETNLVASKEGTITIDKINVNGSELAQGQYTFQNNKLTIDGQYVTGGIVIFVSFAEQSQSKPVGITALADGTFSLTLVGNVAELPNLSYSTDNGTTWKTYGADQEIEMTEGSTLLLKGNNRDGWNKHATVGDEDTEKDYAKIVTDFDFNLSGNLSSLLDNNEAAINEIPTSGCFEGLFRGCTTLKSIDKDFFKGLTKLTPYCYACMFYGCTGLTNISDLSLPAEETMTACYRHMFEGCSKLVNAPKILPATDIKEICYFSMFKDCVLLENMPELPATYLCGGGCYQYMFDGCSALKEVHDLPATNSTTCCYSWMFRGCSSLETAPAIAIEYINEQCCRAMFRNCTSLTTPAMMLSIKGFGTSLIDDYHGDIFTDMYNGCTSLKVSIDDETYGTKFMTIPARPSWYYDDCPWLRMFSTASDPDFGQAIYFKIGE